MSSHLKSYHQSLGSKYRQSGMNLIEIIIVVSLLAGLMAIFVQNYTKTQENVLRDQAKIAMGLLGGKLQQFRATNFKYPESIDDLISDPGTYKNWRGPYVEESKLNDPWGNPYEYEAQGKVYKIISSGPDEETGTEDDVVYPDQKKTESNDEG